MALILAAAVSLPAYFVEPDYVVDGYTVDPRTQESTTRLVAYNDITSSAVSNESLYVVDGYYDEGYTIDPRQETSSLNVSGSLLKTPHTLISLTFSTSELSGARTVSTGFVSESTGRHIVAPWIVVSTGMASSTASEMLMPFGMSIDAAAVNPENPYAVDGYVVDDYYIDPRTGLTSVVITPNRVREPLMVLNVQSEVDVSVTQVHTTGVQVDGQSSVVAFGARIELAGVAVTGQSEVDIASTRVFDLGYLTSGQSAVDIGPSLIRTYGALVDGVSTTVIAPNFTGTFGVLSSAQSEVLTGAKVTMVAGALSEAQSSVIISARLKWETVSEPTNGWTVINDDNYPFG